MKKIPEEAGKSSIGLIDLDKLLSALPQEGAKRILDVGCGVGNYAFALADRLQADVKIIGIDPWEKGIRALNDKAGELDIVNLSGFVGTATALPESTAGVDLILMATLVHGLAVTGEAAAAFEEAARTLKPGGKLAVVEFKKEETKPGPPLGIRLDSDDLSEMVEPCGFSSAEIVDLGANCYLALFERL